MYSGLLEGLPFVARAALLACVGGLVCIVRVCLWRLRPLVPDLRCAPVLMCLSALMGRLPVLECAFWDFLLRPCYKETQ